MYFIPAQIKNITAIDPERGIRKSMIFCMTIPMHCIVATSPSTRQFQLVRIGTGVGEGGGVDVGGGIGVDVGGTEVDVGGTEVKVGGTGVDVGGLYCAQIARPARLAGDNSFTKPLFALTPPSE